MINNNSKPIIIAGPCVAESLEHLIKTATFLRDLEKKYDFNLIFKASFDKANRTAISSYRGPGIKTTLEWFKVLKEQFANLAILTDIHETAQIERVASVCDVLQIPAFLCRQTDLIVAAANSGCSVNIKKGQFLDPKSMVHAVNKIKDTQAESYSEDKVFVTERGTSFGYNSLVVDPRSFAVLAQNPAKVIFDITHSTQQPTSQTSTEGLRHFAPLLARSATATGHLSGYFLETHPSPKDAKSDAATQLSFSQTETLLGQLIPFWHQCKEMSALDSEF